jgi:hypothetical protein
VKGSLHIVQLLLASCMGGQLVSSSTTTYVMAADHGCMTDRWGFHLISSVCKIAAQTLTSVPAFMPPMIRWCARVLVCLSVNVSSLSASSQ